MARDLREWFRGFVRKHIGRGLRRARSASWNRSTACSRNETFRQIVHHHDKDDDHLELSAMRRWRLPESLLLPVGEALARFSCGENLPT